MPSAKATAYKSTVQLAAGACLPLLGPVEVSLQFHRPQATGDLDNGLKVLFDALRWLAWMDDSQVVSIHAVRLEERPPRGEVVIEARGEAFATAAQVNAARLAAWKTAEKARATRRRNKLGLGQAKEEAT